MLLIRTVDGDKENSGNIIYMRAFRYFIEDMVLKLYVSRVADPGYIFIAQAPIFHSDAEMLARMEGQTWQTQYRR